MLLNHILLATLWIVYCVIHSLLADMRLKRKLQIWLGKKYKYYRLFYTFFAFIFLTGLLYFQISINTVQLFARHTVTIIAGSILSLSGLVLMLVCIKKYFISLSGLLSIFKEGERGSLLISGVHRYIRHPLYLGTFAFIWGLFLIFPYLSLFISNSLITIYTLIGIRLEETKLVAEFGDSYRQYQKQVPRLIPSFKNERNF